MKRILAILCIALVSLLNAQVLKGVHYEILPFNVNAPEKSVIKVSRYNCQFCYKYDELVVDKVISQLSEFEYIPYHSAYGAEFGKLASSVLAVMIAKDKDDNVSLIDEKSSYHTTNMAIYKAYHSDKNDFGGDSTKKKNVNKFLKIALKPTGMSIKEYEERLQTPKVKEILDIWGVDESGMAAKLAGIQGVPSFIVDGKYIINPRAIQNPTQFAQMIKEISDLDWNLNFKQIKSLVCVKLYV